MFMAMSNSVSPVIQLPTEEEEEEGKNTYKK